MLEDCNRLKSANSSINERGLNSVLCWFACLIMQIYFTLRLLQQNVKPENEGKIVN
jgi:hypothetical protein